MTKGASVPLWPLSRARIIGVCGTLERVEVTGLPRTCGAQVTARMSVRAARCARGLCRLLSLHQAEPGRSPGVNPNGKPGPIWAGPEPGTRMPGRRHWLGLLLLELLLLLLLHPPHRNVEVLYNSTTNRLQAQQLYV